VTIAFANSAGQRLTGRQTAAGLDGIARTGTSDGSGRLVSARLGDIDGAAIGQRAARKARDAADATDLEPGQYEVVLEPRCVADLLQFLFVYGFNGRAVEEGRSFVRIGEQQFDEAITLREDVADAAQVGIGFDIEGTPRRGFELIKNGVTGGVLHTRRTAARAGTESTGNAVEGGDSFGAIPVAPVLASGDGSFDDLVGGVERGLLVTDFWYTRILDPRTQVVTGLTRNGVWLIENGAVVRPVSNLRFTQSYLEAIGPGAVKRVGGPAELVSAGFGALYLVPPLHLASWNFTGGARG
jgi:predicted Zn-dependent protease